MKPGRRLLNQWDALLFAGMALLFTLVACEEETPVEPPPPPLITIGTSATAVVEGASVTLTLRTSQVASGTVSLSVSGPGISDADYTIQSTEVTFSSTREREVTFTALDEGAIEGDEVVTISIESADDFTIGVRDEVEIRIVDVGVPDVQPSVSFGETSIAGTEADTLVIPVEYMIGNVTASVATLEVRQIGTSTEDEDYEFITGPIVQFSPDTDSTAEVQILLRNDGIEEGTEEIAFEIFNLRNAELQEPSNVTVTIDDGEFPTITFSSASASVFEGDTMVLDLIVSNLADVESKVRVSVSGSALENIDYDRDAIDTVLTFSLDNPLEDVKFFVFVDGEENENDIVTIELTGPENIQIGAFATQDIEIFDVDCDELPTTTDQGLTITPVQTPNSGDFLISSFKVQREENGEMVGVTDLDVGFNNNNADFLIYENGVLSTHSESQRCIKRDTNTFVANVLLLLDVSGGIIEDDGGLDSLKIAAISLAEQALAGTGNEVRVEVALFDGESEIRTLKSLSTDLDDLSDSINSISKATNQIDPTTNLYGAYIEGAQRVQSLADISEPVQGSDNEASVSYMVLFTDGTDRANLETLNNAMAASDAAKAEDGDALRIYTIGFGEDVNTNVLELLGPDGTRVTTDQRELETIFSEIGQEISNDAQSYYFIQYCYASRAGSSNLWQVEVSDDMGNTGSYKACFTAFDTNNTTCDCTD